MIKPRSHILHEGWDGMDSGAPTPPKTRSQAIEAAARDLMCAVEFSPSCQKMRIERCACVDCASSRARAALAMPEAVDAPVWKDHQTAELVNQLRDVAIKYHAAGQLRAQIQNVILPVIERLNAAPELKP